MGFIPATQRGMLSIQSTLIYALCIIHELVVNMNNSTSESKSWGGIAYIGKVVGLM